MDRSPNSDQSNLTRAIVEALYVDALVLAEEVRAVFAQGTTPGPASSDAHMRLALSTEGLKTTTRMMQVLAWLLNQRAYFTGELSEAQVRNHGELPPDRPADERALALLPSAVTDLIAETMQLHERIARLDEASRGKGGEGSPARAMHDSLKRRIGEID
ncbi:MAG: DUF1465 family protein [Erythrobacter sp.]